MKKGSHHTEEALQKMRLVKIGKHQTKETKRKIGLSKTGKHRSKETIEKVRVGNIGKHEGEKNPMYGKHHTEGAKEKMRLAKKDKPLSGGHKKNISLCLSGENCYWFGKHLSEEHKQKLRLAKIGKPLSKEHKKKIGIANTGRCHTEEAKQKIGFPKIGKPRSKETKEKLRFALSGERHPNWKGGITPLVMRIRELHEYSTWRTAVLTRDNYTCRSCHETKTTLNAHHNTVPFSILFMNFLKEYDQFSPIEDKETLVRLAIKYKPFWNVDNGITLCDRCHKEAKENKECINT